MLPYSHWKREKRKGRGKNARKAAQATEPSRISRLWSGKSQEIENLVPLKGIMVLDITSKVAKPNPVHQILKGRRDRIRGKCGKVFCS